jgi:CO/xanthine dehydrogenase Mo-binding subunit
MHWVCEDSRGYSVGSEADTQVKEERKMADLSVIGKAIPRLDALEKVTGRAKFTSDFTMPGMLYAKIVKSLYPHARIVRIDTSKPERLPGVRAIVLPEDAPNMRFGHSLFDEFVLPRDNLVRCIGQPIALVVADTIEIAEEAVDMVEVDYEELPAVFDAEEALLENPPAIVHPEMSEGFYSLVSPFSFDPSMPNCFKHFKIRHGDVNKGFEQADIVMGNRYSTARISHSYLETRQVDAWVEPDGTLSIRTSAQTPSVLRLNFAMLFGVPLTKMRVITPYIGGGFGGKVGNETMLEPLALLAAIKTRRPIHLVYTREEEFVGGRHRADVLIYIKDGVKKDGTLVAREMRVILNIGRHAHLGFVITRNMAFGAVGTYRIPNFKWDSYGVYTNNPPTGAFRGFGSPEVNWAIEQQMDRLAEELNIDAVEIRKKNILREGDKDVSGQTTVAIGVGGCLDKVAKAIEWDKKQVQEEGPWKKSKGLAIGSKYTFSVPALATVKVHGDGGVEVRHGNVEIGQGLNTVVAQIAAEEFKIGAGDVKVVYGDTTICPYDYGSVSSRSTFFTGNAVRLACQDAKGRILEKASIRLNTSPDKLNIKAGKVFVTSEPEKGMNIGDLFGAKGVPLRGGEIIGTGTFVVPMVPEDPETGRSERSVTFYSYFAHAVEVAVNMETGEVKVLKIVGAADMGTPINPEMAKAQIEGGFGQGIGTSIYERIVLENGTVVNPNFADYKMPTAAEIPSNRNVKVIMNPVPHREGPFGAKGIGEGTIVPIAPAISNAIYNAIGARIGDLPITREKILNKLAGLGKK